MDYAAVAEALEAEADDGGAGHAATAFPDGSVDVFYAVADAIGDSIDSRETFGGRIESGDAGSFLLRRESTEPGGQSVNAADQLAALGDAPTLFGHLDDPVFDALPFGAVSMGPPSRVHVYDFADGGLMFAEIPDVMDEWTLADLREAAGDSFQSRLSADIVSCANWISFGNMTDALQDLAETDVEADGSLFAFDPGDLTGTETVAIERLAEALGRLDGAGYGVLCSATGDEIRRIAEALGVDAEGDAEPSGADRDDGVGPDGRTAVEGRTLERVRERMGVTAVVRHDRADAAVATREGRVDAPNLAIDGDRQTGAGDRFLAGVAHGVASEWDWDGALRLGNLCASFHVDRSRSGTVTDLAAYARERETR